MPPNTMSFVVGLLLGFCSCWLHLATVHMSQVELLVKEKEWLEIWGGILLLAFCTACWLFYFFLRSVRDRLRRRNDAARRDERRRNNTARELSLRLVEEIKAGRGPRPNLDDIPEALRCVVCLIAEREVILVNCGHVCVCADCAENLLRMIQGCPVCRSALNQL